MRSSLGAFRRDQFGQIVGRVDSLVHQIADDDDNVTTRVRQGLGGERRFLQVRDANPTETILGFQFARMVPQCSGSTGISRGAMTYQKDRQSLRMRVEHFAMPRYAPREQIGDSFMRSHRRTEVKHARSRRERQKQIGNDDSGEISLVEEKRNDMNDGCGECAEYRGRVRFSFKSTGGDLGEPSCRAYGFSMDQKRRRGIGQSGGAMPNQQQCVL